MRVLLVLGFALAGVLATAAAAVEPVSVASIDLAREYQVRLQGLGAGPARNAGDVNGDRIPDALVAVPGAPSTVFVVHGRREAWSAHVTLPELAPPAGYRLVRPGPESSRFHAVEAGDVNGDGIPDALVGYATDDGSTGEAYVLFGRRGDLPPVVDLTRLTSTQGYRIAGPPGSLAGSAVADAGDVDGDGVPDALVGAPGADGGRGAVYVVYGRRSAPAGPISLASLGSDDGYWISGAPGDGLGEALAAAGDVNGDAVPDALVGAPSADRGSTDSGSVYVVFGRRAEPEAVELDDAVSWGYRIDGAGPSAHAGFAVDDAGDVNGDGRPDALLGAPGAAGSPLGAAFVVFGRGGASAAPIGLQVLADADGYRIAHSQEGSGAGFAVAGLGDVTGDGVPDAIVGAVGARWRTGSGAAYVVYGRRGSAEGVDLAALTAADGYVVGGLPRANAGWAVANAGDADGDGAAEAWIWAPNYSPTPSAAGATLLVGRPRPAAKPETGRTAVGRGRAVRVTLSCAAALGSTCAGAVRLFRGPRIVASAGFSLSAAQRRTVTLRLSPAAARLLRRRGRLRVIVRAVAAAEPPAPATLHSRELLIIRR